MKQRITLLFLLVLTMLGAKAGSVKVYIDHPEFADITWDYNTVTDFQSPMTFETSKSWASLSIEPKDDYTFSKAEDSSGNPIPLDSYGAINIRPFNYNEEETFYIEIKSLEEARTSSMTLNVDAPEMLNISRKGSAYSYIELQPGENTVKFNPLTDNSLIIKARNYNGMIYKVEADGVEIPLTSNSSGMSCEAPIKEGSVVNVTYVQPSAIAGAL